MLVDKCIQTVENTVLPRLKILWGNAADIDGDGRIGIVIAPSINEEKTAIGFFNPADFYNKNSDINSVAVPDGSPGSSYSVESIIATIAHELTHVITYTNKTWRRQINGQTDAAREELFLDEGMSHLSENLCGYGISGGNIKFLRKFFEATADYSFCEPNRYGQEDSAGMRGAMSLFLTWLFWRQGGIEFEGTDPDGVIDKGGAAFLQALVNSPDMGWGSIGKAADTDTKVLFEEMTAQINLLRGTGQYYKYKVDTTTKEPVDFFANMKNQGDADIIIGFPKEYDISARSNIGAWSFMFFSILRY